MPYSGRLGSKALVIIDVSEERVASIRVIRNGELGTPASQKTAFFIVTAAKISKLTF
jgi:hypothetical protein